ncbi:stage II sporulation protein P [Clostridium sp. CM027]|uniref:stage II sporulation protein P n=1 Tax=Clostridium sp. CM027 TaxID=2849865 RepID=UPI001C6E4473|nr:stage II sporulation protein P [Clostridium sp. CM027]MBW9146471.1 stage II sporulation protein P [Clostridium sp. CM027]UVE41971.1 stage II sporulation protein P [Clostridium sp. CM027]
MRRKVVKKDDSGRMFLSISTFLIIILLGLILTKSVNASNERKFQNHFYIKVVNLTLASINSPNTGKQDVNNEIKNENSTNNEGENIKTVIPFKLIENQVNKSEDPNVVSNLPGPDLKQPLNRKKPRVLIYHTHTSEAYRTSDNDTSKTNSSTDQTRNVCAVGDVIKENLEKKYGIAVIHDKTVNDKPYYPKAYKKSGVTLDKYLKVYENFDLIIDLHRDSVNDKNTVTTKIDGGNVAQFMFVIAQQDPKYAQQKKLIDSMIGISNKLYPNLLRGLEITVVNRGIGFYNQNRSGNAVLIELGSYTNTTSEAKNTGKYLSIIIAEQLNRKK